jgi:hypothetical protein
VSVEIGALLSQLDRGGLPPAALEALRTELAQLLECSVGLRALALDGIEPALGPQRWT